MEIWLDPGSWTPEQWIAVCILVFIVIAVIAVAYRLYGIIKSVNRKRELPNLRPGRRAGRDRRGR